MMLPHYAMSEVGEAKGDAIVVGGNTTFALELYGHLKGTEGNVFFSPFSISTCLAMTSGGASGQTLAEMGRVLHLEGKPAEIGAAFGKLQRELNEIQKSNKVQLNLANGLWTEKAHPFLPAFLKSSEENYEAVVRQADFRSAAEPTRLEINGWVAKQTQDKIKDLFGPGTINQNTRLALVNAIYFKGKWKSPFDAQSTMPLQFWAGGKREVMTPTMRAEKQFGYSETSELQVLDMPYEGEDLSLLVLLPKERTGMKGLEMQLSVTNLAYWISALRAQKVEVSLPKIHIQTRYTLNDTLAGMGMRTPFSTQADFSGIDGRKELFISVVVHQAFVDVNEEGTEAAAATGVAMAPMAMSKPPPRFIADHPFIFLIRERRSGSVLFLGRFTDPGK
jgi:serpin B